MGILEGKALMQRNILNDRTERIFRYVDAYNKMEVKNMIADFVQRVTNTATQTIPQSGVGLGGSIIAVVTSWDRNKSIMWAVIHGIFGWFYVIYLAFTRKQLINRIKIDISRISLKLMMSSTRMITGNMSDILR